MLFWNYDHRYRNYSSGSNAGQQKSPDRKNGSPQRSTNSFSISPKKHGQKRDKEQDLREQTKVSRIGVVRFVNPKTGQISVPAAAKDPSPKKRGSASRLSDLRDSKVVNTLDNDRSDAKLDQPKKEDPSAPEIVYQSPLLNNSNIHLQTSQDGSSLTCTVDFDTYQRLKNMDPRMQQAVLQEISQIHMRQQQHIKQAAIPTSVPQSSKNYNSSSSQKFFP